MNLVRPYCLGSELLSVLVLVFSACSLYSKIEWENTSACIEIHPGEVEKSTVYPFRNTGDKPVTIQSLTVSCDCLAASADQRTYAPGESGCINVKVSARSLSGQQKKKILVETDLEKTPASLELQIVTEEPFVLSDKVLVWPTGDRKEKRVEMRLAKKGTSFKPTGVSGPDAFTYSLREIEAGDRWQIAVTPKPGAVTRSGALVVRTACPPASPRNYTIQLRLLSSEKNQVEPLR